MIALWPVLALAGPEPHLVAGTAVGDGAAGVSPWIGGGAGVGVRVLDPLMVGAEGRLGATLQGDPMGLLRAQARFGRGLAALAGAGVQLDGHTLPLLSGGVMAEFPFRAPVMPRVEAEYVWTPGDEPIRFLLSMGFTFRKPERKPEPAPVAKKAPEPAPAPAPPGEPGVQPPPDAMVWVPTPVCQWHRSDDRRALEALGGALEQARFVDARLVGDPTVDPFAPPADVPAAGGLVVAAWPGDVVTVDGQPVQADGRGIAVLDLPEGVARIEVRGGGRVLERDVAVADGHAIWLSVPPPAPARITFSVGSSQLDHRARTQVAELAAAAAGWRLEVVGSASPEGTSETNTGLALERARAVAAALIQWGVPESSVVMVEPEVPEDGLELPEQRAAVIRPVPPEEEP